MVLTSLGRATDSVIRGCCRLPDRAGLQRSAELPHRRRAPGHEPLEAVDPDDVDAAAGGEDNRLARQPVPLRAAVLEPAVKLAVGPAGQIAGTGTKHPQ